MKIGPYLLKLRSKDLFSRHSVAYSPFEFCSHITDVDNFCVNFYRLRRRHDCRARHAVDNDNGTGARACWRSITSSSNTRGECKEARWPHNAGNPRRSERLSTTSRVAAVRIYCASGCSHSVIVRVTTRFFSPNYFPKLR